MCKYECMDMVFISHFAHNFKSCIAAFNSGMDARCIIATKYTRHFDS